MSILIGLFVLTAVVFLYFSYRWESTFKRPPLENFPLVSILIPAYNSEKRIAKCIKSALNLDYPKKEIFVVNDSLDGTPKICRKMGVGCIQNKVRKGKAVALNEAVKQTKGSILYFLDADTVTRKDALKKMVSWFRDKKIAVVSPRFVTQNPVNALTKIITVENSFTSSLYKIHMFFGSLIAFRGCGVAIRKSTFENLGGWPKTQIEDNDFAALVVRKGYKIQYDPEAIVETREAETIKELQRQRMRWGKGAFYTFWNHKSGYTVNKQFLISTLPYAFLALSILVFIALQSYYFLLPAFSFFVISAYSYHQFASIFLVLILPLLTNMFAVIATGTVSHFALLTYPENSKSKTKDLLYLFPYIFFYVPTVVYFYSRGIIAGIADKIKKKDQLDFQYW